MSAVSWQAATAARLGCDLAKGQQHRTTQIPYFNKICLPLPLFSSSEPLAQSAVVSTFSMLHKEVICYREVVDEIGTGGLVGVMLGCGWQMRLAA